MPVRVLLADPVDGVPSFLLCVTGALDWVTGNEFAAIGVKLLDQACGPIHLRVDLGGVTYADLTGLSSVETVADAVAGRTGTVVLDQMSLAVFRLLETADKGGDWLDLRGCRVPS